MAAEETELVGEVVSISHEVESELLPALPVASWMLEESTVNLYSPSAAVRPESPPISYVEPETRLMLAALVIRFAPLLSVSESTAEREGGEVDRFAEGDVDRRDGRVSRVGGDGRNGSDGQGPVDHVGDGAAGA